MKKRKLEYGWRFRQGADGRKSIPCICPKCGKEHTKSLFYNGHLPARIYCYICWRNTIRRPGEDSVYKEWDYGGKLTRRGSLLLKVRRG